MKRPFALLVPALLLSLAACSSTSQTGNNGSASSAGSSGGPAGWAAENRTLSANKNTFVAQVSERHAIPRSHIEQLLATATVDDRVIRLMTPKGSGGRVTRAWQSYRSRFVEPIRLRKGTAFWNANRQTLNRAEQTYGVPAAIVAAIIGVETVYGEQTGSFRVLDTLYTLGFNHPEPNRPEKSQMFRNQLAALLDLDYRDKVDANSTTGSFAGAIGLPQFMPVSIEHYAVDGDNDGHIDLRNSTKDAIMSVANYLAKHGWRAGEPVFAPVTLPAGAASLVDGGLEPSMSWSQLQSRGASLRAGSSGGHWQNGKEIGVIDLRDEVRGSNEYRTATRNFFAITKYNRSYFYAASVADLAYGLASRQRSSGYQVTMPY
ncbi:lytic murein transglycosylase B [Advenella mimigardefordensis]|uniref:lytic murein transglycosylase B n=1 Tax=Advenella mimigardefordensis TaxID=302406 RepID=UPI00046D030D|nr:lytic murein transglycosylase B [Advenella mimigardefordensis]